MHPSPHQNLMVSKKGSNALDSRFVAANKNAAKNSVCAIVVLHHKNTIMPRTPTGTQIFMTDRNDYDLVGFAYLPDPGGMVSMMMVKTVLLVAAAAAWFVLSGSNNKPYNSSKTKPKKTKARMVIFTKELPERKKIKTVIVNSCLPMPLSPCIIQLWLFAGYLAMAITAQGCEKEVMCRRDRPETCRGTPTKLVEVVASDNWDIPVWQTQWGEDGMVLSAFGDTDGDGDVDMVGLVCYAKATGHYCSAKLIFYENVAVSVPGTPPSWEARASDYEKGKLAGIIPPGFEYESVSYPGFRFYHSQVGSLILIDHDHDGDLDLVLTKQYHSNLFDNVGSSTSAEWLLKTSPFGAMGTNYVLAFADMDMDGDLDAVRGIDAGDVDYYENTGTDISPVYQKKSPMIFKSPYTTSVVLRDLDNDGDFDLLVGSGSNDANIYILENTGSRFEQAWTRRSSVKWMGLNPLHTGFRNWVHVQQMIDLNMDGMDELVYRTDSVGAKFFRRTKVAGLAGFVAQAEWALAGVDVGDDAAPVGVNFNDGSLEDLIVGTQINGLKYFEQTRIGKDGVEYAACGENFKCESSAGVSLRDKSGVEIKGVVQGGFHSGYLRPSFLDIGNDDDFDLILGTYDQGLWLYKNTGDSNNYQLERQTSWASDQACKSATGFHNKGCWAATGDFDGDTFMDVIAGENKNVKMYQRTTSAATLTRKTEWEGSSTNGLPKVHPLGGITFGDVDQDGDNDAVVGTYDGTLEYYERIQVSPPKWEKKDAAAGWSLADVDVGQKAKPALLDYDNDGDLDLIVGNGDGFLLLFEQGICEASCTDKGSCNIGSEYMPTCKCSFEGATANRSCNSCDGGYHFVPSDLTSVSSIDGSDAGTCSSCGPGNFGKFQETRKSKDETCETCPSGFYQGDGASAICHQCPIGWYQNGGEFKYCFSCLPGEWQNDVGQSECKECPEGWFRNQDTSSSGNECKR